jgi:hypothetical protein
MTAISKKFGTWGAVMVLGLAVALVIVQECLPYGTSAWKTVHQIIYLITLPVMSVWEAVLPWLGFRGDQGLAFIIPVFASVLVYFGALGFGFGVLISLIRRH